MRIYIELIELQEDGGEESDFIRIDVTEWLQRDINTAIELLKEHAQVYEHCVLQLHYCRHEDNEPCSVTVLESR
jgi:hypothetical protein